MTFHLFIESTAAIAVQDLPLIGANNAAMWGMPSFLDPKEKPEPDGIAETSADETTGKSAEKLAETAREDEAVMNTDDTTLMERDHTYVLPNPVTNWEWEQEENGGTYLK